MQQGPLSVSSYYTRLKILWDEFKDFQPIPTCNCGGKKAWMNYQDQDCVMQLLMGLNDSYAQTRASILLMDPLPQIGKVFALVTQEERQQTIQQGLLPTSEPLSGNSDPTSNDVISSFSPIR